MTITHTYAAYLTSHNEWLPVRIVDHNHVEPLEDYDPEPFEVDVLLAGSSGHLFPADTVVDAVELAGYLNLDVGTKAHLVIDLNLEAIDLAHRIINHRTSIALRRRYKGQYRTESERARRELPELNTYLDRLIDFVSYVIASTGSPYSLEELRQRNRTSVFDSARRRIMGY